MVSDNESDDDFTFVEVTLPDGTVARWACKLTDEQTDNLTDAIERVIGSPSTIIL